jgi:hypothetical protein
MTTMFDGSSVTQPIKITQRTTLSTTCTVIRTGGYSLNIRAFLCWPSHRLEEMAPTLFIRQRGHQPGKLRDVS